MLLQGKTALITGGSQGIGRAIACAFAAEGTDLIVVDLEAGNARRAAPASRDSQSRESRRWRRNQVVGLFDAIDRLDILVNNAWADEAQQHGVAPVSRIRQVIIE